MARKPASKSAKRSSSPSAKSSGDPVAAFMTLLAEKSFEEIGLGEIAERAGLSLAELRDQYASKIAMLAVRTKAIDRAVLAAGDDDMEDEPPRERLFDVLMRRFEAMADDKAAVRSLMRSACRNPGLAMELNRLAVNSQQWMLTAAGIAASGPKGMIRAQGIAVLFAKVARIWVDDDEEGHARTMAALDRALARGQRWSGMLDDLSRIAEAPGRMRSRWRARRRGDDRDEAVAM